MKMHNDCFPCLARAALDTARLSTEDEAVQLALLKAVLKRLSAMDPALPPPLVAREIYEILAAGTGVKDPYEGLKKKYNDLALDLYPWLGSLIDEGETRGRERFETAVRLALAGNIIDFASASSVGKERLMTAISHSLETRVMGSVTELKQSVDSAKRILWLGDNSGEIVFDKLMLEEMDPSRVIYAVRGGPVQNDATLTDARDVGLTDMVKVISSGSLVPGTLVEQCSEEFVRIYERADLIISKGQGNFETLDHSDPRIFFLFKAKCPVVARQAGCDPGEIVIRQMRPAN